MSNHLSDELLIQVINDDQFETEQSGIETHISNCDQCRARLETLSEPQWIEEHRIQLAQEYQSSSNSNLSLVGLMVGTDSTAAAIAKPTKSDRDFELRAIEQMLDEILLPSIHPETKGRLGDYEIENTIGYGGMGIVLRAYDRELQRPVAIKLIVPRLAHDGTAKQRFAREARAAAAVLHPNVIAIHGISETNGMPWFVMPLVNGPTLRGLVEQNGPLNERDIVRIGLQITSGLAAAHSQGVIHRDVKPENILVDNHVNRVVITDFGLARKEFDATLTKAGVLAGTLNYMSPEQAQGADTDERSDLFSLGSLLYYLATGVAPFRSASPANVIHKVVSEKQKDVRALNPEISEALAQTIDALLAKDPGDRFQTANELEDYLVQLVSHLNQPTKNRLPKLPVIKKSWLASTVLAGSFAVLLLASAFVYWGVDWDGSSKSVTPADQWSKIQETYSLDSPESFAREMQELEDSVSRLGSDIDGQRRISDDDGLNRNISQMLREMDELGKQLDFDAVGDSAQEDDKTEER
jgi:serine/threonine-protein kinase